MMCMATVLSAGIQVDKLCQRAYAPRTCSYGDRETHPSAIEHPAHLPFVCTGWVEQLWTQNG
jgi:hypothetical protein